MLIYIIQNVYSPFYRLIYAKNGVNAGNTELEIINVSNENLTEANIVQNANIVGKALFETAAKSENDGVYLGFQLQGINSLTNILLNGSNIVNNTFDIF
jgi:hypothetical protein